MKTLAQNLSDLCHQALLNAFPHLNLDTSTNLIEEPKDKNHGDYASHLALKYAKELKQKPLEVADIFVKHFPESFLVEEISILGPGFINFRLNKAFLEDQILILSQGLEKVDSLDKTIIIDYTSTNAAKFIGVHHIITIFLGDALARLFEHRGYKVMRINHLGDWGTNFGILIEAFLRWGSWEKVQENPCKELNELYVRFHKEAEEKTQIMDEARARFKKLEDGDEESMMIWKKMIQESILEIDKTLDIFDVKVEHIGESFYLERAKKVIEDGVNKKVFVTGEGGSLIYPFENPEETPALIQKSDGTSLYLTRDLATVQYRAQTWHPYSIFYVVDYAQSLHFKQTFHIAKSLGYNESAQLEHIAFGRMSFSDRSMSTRKGNIIPLLDVYHEAIARSKTLAQEKSTIAGAELEKLSESMAINSLKYGVLNQDRVKDIIFDWDKVITLEGNSAPYLMYSLARIATILEKLGPLSYQGLPKIDHPLERELSIHLLRYPEILERCEKDRKVHGLCVYLFELAQIFSRFYGECHILQAENELAKYSRSVLLRSTQNLILDAFDILGLKPIQKM